MFTKAYRNWEICQNEFWPGVRPVYTLIHSLEMAQIKVG